MIRMSELASRPAAHAGADREAALRVLGSGRFVLGDEVAAFESNWATACGARWAVGVGNGMDALEISLRAMGIGRGDEVVTTAMTAFATVLAIIRAGATPVLADIESDTGLLSLASVQRCLSAKTRAILLVHLYGQVRGMDGWLRFSREHRLELVEDCAQAHLASAGGVIAGNFGRVGAYSFYPTKNLGAAGDGGAVVGSDEVIGVACRELRDYGQRSRYLHVREGLNSRLDEIQAAILNARLEWLGEATRRRQLIAARYHAGLRNPAVALLAPPESTPSHVQHLFVVRCTRRDALAGWLADAGIESAIHYPVPMHLQPALSGIRRDPQGLAVAQAHALQCLSFPCHPGLSEAESEAVIAAVNRYH